MLSVLCVEDVSECVCVCAHRMMMRRRRKMRREERVRTVMVVRIMMVMVGRVVMVAKEGVGPLRRTTPPLRVQGQGRLGGGPPLGVQSTSRDCLRTRPA